MAKTIRTVKKTDAYDEITEITEEYFEPPAFKDLILEGMEISVSGIENILGRFYHPTTRLIIQKYHYVNGYGDISITDKDLIIDIDCEEICLIGSGKIDSTSTDPLKCTTIKGSGKGEQKVYQVYFPRGIGTAIKYFKKEINYSSGISITTKVIVEKRG